MSRVVDEVRVVVQPIVDEQNLELVDMEFLKEGKNWFLRIYIDKPGGIDIEECALISEKVSEALDAIDPDPIPQAYFLEVSSPGAERPLKTEADMQNAIGKYVHLSFYQAIDGEKFYEGTLKEVNDDSVVLTIRIKTRTKDIEIERKQIANARLAIQF
ncbi:MAG: ribosome maturation factor RimP [Trichococcus flocculiformis]|uniref:Ribosome maturation factor RimP n=2 Tax=Trichococcus TaxID=82802 RepID=A0A143Y7W0_9LACT|nr:MULTISPECIES: ribosome maturation factor RimP [Trichococcus]MBP6164526.1 ribosome maturation factor RimP [Trichococcus sp.]NCB64544.1 ribosome maturation factor RimP [Bacilli bacterium]MBP9977619.1 ribosome maturation factor RimP [Trichococcus sp.]NLD33157.1 ribosome maturation factor RimP [Trichococcus flocculiformis]CZQ82163.1 ribosome maturation factor rimp [Trichococcus flocculiformis]